MSSRARVACGFSVVRGVWERTQFFRMAGLSEADSLSHSGRFLAFRQVRGAPGYRRLPTSVDMLRLLLGGARSMIWATFCPLCSL